MCVLYFSENVLSELGILILVLTSALKLIVFSIFHVNVLTENSVRLDKMSQNLSTKEKYFDIKEKYFCSRNLSSFYIGRSGRGRLHRLSAASLRAWY